MNDFFETPTKIIRQVFEFNVIKIHEISKRIDLITKEGDMRAVSLSQRATNEFFIISTQRLRVRVGYSTT